jgi:hypothetical protein
LFQILCLNYPGLLYFRVLVLSLVLTAFLSKASSLNGQSGAFVFNTGPSGSTLVIYLIYTTRSYCLSLKKEVMYPPVAQGLFSHIILTGSSSNLSSCSCQKLPCLVGDLDCGHGILCLDLFFFSQILTRNVLAALYLLCYWDL